MKFLLISTCGSILFALTLAMPPHAVELFSLTDWLHPIKDEYKPKTMAEMILPHGYPLEEHEVETEDGYLLSVYRIPYGKNNTGSTWPRPAVLVQHGIMANSACWVLSDPEKGLGFVLADAGYDVWISNSRGTTYSRKHKTLDPDVDKKKFWDFSFHEMGYYDLPAVIDFIRSSTDQDKIFYVGHSQGTTMFFAMASSRPEYNDKIKLMSALAPIAFLDHTRGAVRVLSTFTNIIAKVTNWFGIYEVLSDTFFLHFLDAHLCKLTAVTRPLCDNLLFLIAGYDSQQLNVTLVPEIVDHSPSGASTKQLIHFGQLANNGEKFQMFDYGDDNKKKYGASAPPDYPLEKITTPIILHYADNDWLAGTQDVEKLYNNLHNATKVEVPFSYFNHLDFMWAIDVRSLVYDPMINIMKQHE